MINFIQNQNKDDSVVYYLSKYGTDFRLSRNFTLIEMASRDGTDIVLVSPLLIVLLQHLREHFSSPVNINSGYRSVKHNNSIGGRSDSAHLYGMAGDITIFGYTPNEVWKYLNTLDPGGLGRYNSFTHVDVRGINRRWDNRS